MKIAICCGGLALAVLSASAQEVVDQREYRQGQPAVLSPDPSLPVPAESLPWRDLSTLLAKRRLCRVVLLWESRLSDDINTSYDHVVSEQSQSHANALAAGQLYRTHRGASKILGVGADADSSSTRHEYSQAANAPVPVDESVDTQIVRTTFMRELHSGGVQFVDRGLTTRLAGANAQNVDPNRQAFEIAGLTRYADLLLEVNSQPDTGGQFGVAFHVVVRDLHAGKIMVDFITNANVPIEQPRGYVAGNGGFERAQPRQPNTTEMVHQLAVETGQHLVGALRDG
jgi:hypothetical protein